MNNLVLVHTLRFLLLLLIQVLVLNEIQLHGFINPYIYPLFLMLLPFDAPRWLVLILGFFLGLLIDIYANTLGFHAASCVWIAFIREAILNFIKPPNGYDGEQKPVLVIMGLQWSLFYISACVILHHTLLFFIETASFANFHLTLSKIFISSIFSISLMMLYQFVLVPRQ